MKNRLGLQTVVGLLVIGIVITACSGAVPTPTSVAEVQGQGPAVQIGSAALGPDKTMSVCAGQTVALTTKATGRDLTYTWSVDGNGQLQRQEGKGDVASSNRYTAPTTTGEEVVKVTVIDDVNQSGTDQVIIQVVECASPTPTEPSVTDTPKPTDTPGPSTEEPTPEFTEEAISTPSTRGGCPFEAPIRNPVTGPPVDAEVRITSMEHCADNLPTAAPIPLSGTYSGDLTNKEIWILVYPPNLVYYPQSTNACASLSTTFANGQWQEKIILGRKGVPEAFHIVAVVTEVGSSASEDFHDYLNVGCKTEDYEGRAIILSGATELDSIIVHTR
jgi:hypothetical protein